MVSLVNFISREPEEFMVTKATITHNAKANFGLVSVAKKEFVGKKVQKIYLKYAMIVGLM